MLDKSVIEKKIYKTIRTVKTFPSTGIAFEAHADAVEFLKENGYSVGSMQRDMPIGVAKGEDVYISKWMNLGDDVKQLDGVLLSDDFREGSVTVLLSEEL